MAPSARPQILAACPEFAMPALRRVLAGHADLMAVNSLELAQQAIRQTPDLALVIAGVHFDESRMYDLLTFSRRHDPGLPFMCVRILDAEIPRISREAIRIAAESLGAVAFVDFASLASEHGAGLADEQLRLRVMAALRPQARTWRTK